MGVFPKADAEPPQSNGSPNANDSEEIKKEIVLASQRKITVATIRCELAPAVDRGGVNSVDHFARRSALGPFAESHEDHIRRPDTGVWSDNGCPKRAQSANRL